MDDLLPQILSFPPHPPPQIPLSDRQFDSAIRDQIDAVKKIKAAKFLEKTLGGANLLDVRLGSYDNLRGLISNHDYRLSTRP